MSEISSWLLFPPNTEWIFKIKPLREISPLSVHLTIKIPILTSEQQFKICWYKSFNRNFPDPEEIWIKRTAALRSLIWFNSSLNSSFNLDRHNNLLDWSCFHVPPEEKILYKKLPVHH